MSSPTSALSLAVAALAALAGVVYSVSPSNGPIAAGAALATSITLIVVSRVTSGSASSAGGASALHAEEWRSFPLISKEQISANTAIYRFKLPHPKARLGLPIGQHISVKARIAEKDVLRSYTPVSSDDDEGVLDLLIKSYPQGNVSKMFAELQLGDKVEIKGPKGQFKYVPNMVREMGMIAGGTGLTPMLQVVKAILKNPDDKTKIKFIFANVNVEDILLKEQLDGLAAAHSDRFSIYYVLNNAPEGWTGGVGFVTKQIIAEHIPAPAKDVKLLLCGPPPMIKAMTGAAEELGFDRAQTISKAGDQVFKF
ncbi:NADH-cytochrome b5 reductase [Blastocladiella britannica]|nr:NADH-cytochrome b5 reductase [Blastocladiella britannica]